MFYKREDTSTNLEMLYIKKETFIAHKVYNISKSKEIHTKHKVILNKFILLYKYIQHNSTIYTRDKRSKNQINSGNN
jgi:hypothetical protein